MEAITNLYLFLLSTVFISLTGVMTPGPLFAITVAKGYDNKMAGTLIAFGHGVVEFPLMAFIFFGFAWFFAFDTVRAFISLVGGLMLIYIGVEMFKARGKISGKACRNLRYGSLTAGIIATGANPYFFLWWATVGAALIMNASIFGVSGFLLFAIVHWLCDFLWSLSVSMIVFRSRNLWSKRLHEIIFGLCGLVLTGFGAWFIISPLI